MIAARVVCPAIAAVLASVVAATPAAASVELGSGASQVSLEVDRAGDALVTWKEAGRTESVLVPASGQLTHGGLLSGPDVSRPAQAPGVPATVVVRRTPDGRVWALQELQIGAGPQVWLDLSRWQGTPTSLTLTTDGTRIEGRLAFHGAPVSGTTYTLAGLHSRIYVYLDCFGCPGKPGWSPMLGVTPRADGSFAVYLRPSWKGTRYRAAVAGPNLGATLAPDAQTSLSAG